MIESISEYSADPHEPIRLQLDIRSFNRNVRSLRTETRVYEPELSSQESELYSLLSNSEGKTISEIAEIMDIDNTEAYYIITTLQNKKLVKATATMPIKFVAVRHIH